MEEGDSLMFVMNTSREEEDKNYREDGQLEMDTAQSMNEVETLEEDSLIYLNEQLRIDDTMLEEFRMDACADMQFSETADADSEIILFPASPTSLSLSGHGVQPLYHSTPHQAAPTTTIRLAVPEIDDYDESFFDNQPNVSISQQDEQDSFDSLIVIEEVIEEAINTKVYNSKCCNCNCILKFSEHKIEEF